MFRILAPIISLVFFTNCNSGGKAPSAEALSPADSSGPKYGTLVLSCGYDKMTDITTNNAQYGKGTVSKTIYKTGPGSFYSRPDNVSNGNRSEVQYSGDQTPLEGVIEYDVLYEVVVPDNGHSLQFHPGSSRGSAVLGLWHEDGKFVVCRSKEGGLYKQTQPADKTIETNKWYHMRLEYKFDDTAGYYRWYIDNVLYASVENSFVGDGTGQYLKVGYNGWDANSAKSRIYYDNLKIWKK
jgi:hypothetical protein